MQRHWPIFVVLIVNFEWILTPSSIISVVNFQPASIYLTKCECYFSIQTLRPKFSEKVKDKWIGTSPAVFLKTLRLSYFCKLLLKYVLKSVIITFLELISLIDFLFTEIGACFLISDFNKDILIWRSSGYTKCSAELFRKFRYIQRIYSLKNHALTKNSSRRVTKANLFVVICLHNTSWKRVEAVLARPIFLEWYILMPCWRRLKDALKTSWKHGNKTNLYIVTRLEDILKTSWKVIIKANIFFLIKNVLKTTWRLLLKTKVKDIFKTS